MWLKSPGSWWGKVLQFGCGCLSSSQDPPGCGTDPAWRGIAVGEGAKQGSCLPHGLAATAGNFRWLQGAMGCHRVPWSVMGCHKPTGCRGRDAAALSQIFWPLGLWGDTADQVTWKGQVLYQSPGSSAYPGWRVGHGH